MKSNAPIAVALTFLAQTSFADGECLNYGPQVVTLEGRVVLRTFFGPPGYGESPKTDSREKQAILVLRRPICTIANPRDYEDAETDQKEITLVPGTGMALSGYSGKRVSVGGTLFHSHTGHHHTAILISAQAIAKQAD
ncbi:MAG TPA: DUF4431 domain-containing protein [Burkholderiales bacterium]|nr:DUF4431 domain-containing protein [Burkholderiales bacterium]